MASVGQWPHVPTFKSSHSIQCVAFDDRCTQSVIIFMVCCASLVHNRFVQFVLCRVSAQPCCTVEAGSFSFHYSDSCSALDTQTIQLVVVCD